MRHRVAWGLVTVLALTLGVRVLYFFAVVYPKTGDQIRKPDGYWAIAESLLKGGGYIYDAYTADTNVVTAKRGPTTVFFFLALFWLFGVSAWPILVAQWLLEAGTAWLTYSLARQLLPGRPAVAWLAAGLYAVYWTGLRFTAEARGEVVFTFLLAAFGVSLVQALQMGRAAWFALAGLLLGLVHHARPVMSLFPVVALALLIWLYRHNPRVIVQGFTALCLAFGLVLLPWLVRNYLVFQRFIPGTTLLGLVVYYDFRDHLEQKHLLQDERGAWLVPPELILENTSTADYRLGLSEPELDQLWVRTGLELIRRFPGEFVLWCANNVTRFWFNIGRPKWDHVDSEVPFSWGGRMNAALLVLAAAAYALTPGLRRPLALLLPGLIIYYTLIHALTSGELRYSVPMGPYLMVPAAVTLAGLGAAAARRLGLTSRSRLTG